MATTGHFFQDQSPGWKAFLSSSVEDELERAAQILSSLNQRKEMVRTETIEEDEEERTSQKKEKKDHRGKGDFPQFRLFLSR